MNRGYFADMKEFKEHGGKVMMQLLSFCLLLIGATIKDPSFCVLASAHFFRVLKGGLLSLAMAYIILVASVIHLCIGRFITTT